MVVEEKREERLATNLHSNEQASSEASQRYFDRRSKRYEWKPCNTESSYNHRGWEKANGIPGLARTGDLRFRNAPEENAEPLQHNELHSTEGAAYSTAYREIEQDLAHLVDAWPKLAEPLKKAILAIVAAGEMGK